MSETSEHFEGENLGGRVHCDMEFEDALKLMLTTDLRDATTDEAESG